MLWGGNSNSDILPPEICASKCSSLTTDFRTFFRPTLQSATIQLWHSVCYCDWTLKLWRQWINIFLPYHFSPCFLFDPGSEIGPWVAVGGKGGIDASPRDRGWNSYCGAQTIWFTQRQKLCNRSHYLPVLIRLLPELLALQPSPHYVSWMYP